MKKILALILILSAVIFVSSSCGEKEPEPWEGQDFEVTHTVAMEIEDYGTIELELYGKEAPVTVSNFVSLAKSGFYDGLTLHRIIKGFMMQGGDPSADGTGGSKNEILGEFSSNGYTNRVLHKRGAISMARANDPDSGSSQFFIMHETTTSLDGSYAAFGMVTNGINYVDEICKDAKPTDNNGTIPKTKQPKIVSVTVTELVNIEDLKNQRTQVKEPEGQDFEVTHNVTIEIEKYGTIKLELYGKEAPITVENFVKLANSGFYEGSTFHRIIKGFMMQGGIPKDGVTSNMIKGEFSENGVDNKVLHVRGALSMARSNAKDSASSQFFIMHKTTESLDGNYAAFGMVTEGIAIVDKICKDSSPVDNNGTIATVNQPKILKITVTAVGNGENSQNQGSQTKAPVSLKGQSFDVTHTVSMKIENYGIIKLELYGKEAPVTVSNFVSLAKSGFYDGLTFHRIIKTFMMQGGDPLADGTGGSENEILGEFSSNGYENRVLHIRGAISMARGKDPDSGSSQFFIMQETTESLDGSYASFGMVTSGINYIDDICNSAIPIDDDGSIPKEKQPKIVSVTVEEHINIDELKNQRVEVKEPEGQNFEVTHYATIEIENYGTVKLELYGKEAPITVENFVKLASSGFYDGSTFHRIIKGFMMQGGASKNGNTAESIVGEFSANGYDNSILHTRGVISMARSGDPNSASSQFFIMHQTSDHLDGEYAAFGIVVEGIDVVDKVCRRAEPIDNNGTVLLENQPIIKSIRIEAVK